MPALTNCCCFVTGAVAVFGLLRPLQCYTFQVHGKLSPMANDETSSGNNGVNTEPSYKNEPSFMNQQTNNNSSISNSDKIHLNNLTSPTVTTIGGLHPQHHHHPQPLPLHTNLSEWYICHTAMPTPPNSDGQSPKMQPAF